MKRIGKMIGSAAVLGVGLLPLFAQTGTAADDIYGLAAYVWRVSWPGGTSTWCFNQAPNGFYSGKEIGAGNANAASVTYDSDTHVLEMEATSEDKRFVAKYTWTMKLDANNLPTADNLKGTIAFSKGVTGAPQDIIITRGGKRPAPLTCDNPKQ